jgi:hypothetical protein
MYYELTNEELQGQKVPIKTNIDTLKEVWNILREVNLDGLITGETSDISFVEIMDNLLVKGVLKDFIDTITKGSQLNVGDLEISDTVGMISAFFTAIAQPFQGLGMALQNRTLQNGAVKIVHQSAKTRTTESPTPSG